MNQLFTFMNFHLTSWCQQHYSFAWRIPSGALGEVAILWNCLWNLSTYMLRVEWGRWWRQTLIYWVDIWQFSLMNSRQSFVRLLLIIFSVSFTVSLYLTHLTIFLYLNTAHPDDPVDQALELEQEPEKEKKFTLLQRLKLKINRGRRLFCWELTRNWMDECNRFYDNDFQVWSSRYNYWELHATWVPSFLAEPNFATGLVLCRKYSWLMLMRWYASVRHKDIWRWK